MKKEIAVLLLMSLVFLMWIRPSYSQDFSIEEIEDTSGHFATITMTNKMGSITNDNVFETDEGEVRLRYITNAGPFGPHCDTDGGRDYNPLGAYEDCPDEFVVETPVGIVAIPREGIVEENESLEIKLYRYLGM